MIADKIIVEEYRNTKDYQHLSVYLAAQYAALITCYTLSFYDVSYIAFYVIYYAALYARSNATFYGVSYAEFNALSCADLLSYPVFYVAFNVAFNAALPS
jgi:hypothetical protein